MTLRDVIRLIDSDMRQMLKHSAAFWDNQLRWTRRLSLLATPAIMCSVLYRFAHYFHVKRLWPLAVFLTWINYVLNRALISPTARIGAGMYIPHTVNVVFQGHAGAHLTLYAHCMVCSLKPSPRRLAVTSDCPTLGDDVVVGAHSAIVGGIQVGNGAVVGMGGALSESIPAGAVVLPRGSTVRSSSAAGNPAPAMNGKHS